MYPSNWRQLTLSQLKVYKKETEYKPAVGFSVAKRRALLRSLITRLNQKQIELATCFRANDNGQLDRIVDIVLDHMKQMFQTQTANENPFKWVGEGKIMPRSYQPEYIDGNLCTINAEWKHLNWEYAHFDKPTIRLNTSYSKEYKSGVFLLATLIHEICHAFVHWHHPEEYEEDRIKKGSSDRKQRWIMISHLGWWRVVANACLHIFGLDIADYEYKRQKENKWTKAFVKKTNKPVGFPLSRPPIMSNNIANNVPPLRSLHLYNIKEGQIYTIQIGGKQAHKYTIEQLKEQMKLQHGFDSTIILFLGPFGKSTLLRGPNSLGRYGIMDGHKINFYTNFFY